ncbi:MAG: hypothetical protein LC687_05275 [Actinobacteria bacterium]|nr:hypothetical protein [Actinomycetota bacterium]MCA1807244.1 hypothetical protein [Actinomycetota bacterium]
MRAFRADTLTQLHDRLCDTLVLAPPEKLDLITSVDVQIHDVIARAESMVWDFDLKSMWLTPSRWSMMINQYLDPEELEAWIGQCTGKIGTKGRGIAVMRTKMVKPRGGAATGHTNKETRRWGACMLSISYKAKPKPQITLHSRTSYLGYIGALDLSVAWMAGRYLAKELGIKVEDMAFVWQIDAIQWHNFKSLAYLLNHQDLDKQASYRRLLMLPADELINSEKKLILGSPALRLSRKWLQKVIEEDAAGRTYGDMTYNTFRRIVRRFHTEVLGYDQAQEFEGWSYYKKGPKEGEQKEFFKAYNPLPSTSVHDLDFSRLGMPLSRSYGEPFVGGFEDDDDDE